ncbi:hemolysin secretion/activation protein, ShlB/FhaC/HecB family [Arcobacter venerupis]|uniref:Hemolysin secretion/activation protein, ShlB/FhaC/HecB family n=1 Tax=Arcobacter venerupis TaxID=1054033 RepID=A0AAE7E658_9BACT|nr:ShlB/FhaC/HecB family hemolysin secretion/activation protein [Arcobacter venerupis]QKF68531.1 hemolysin secretion/activation protein, ShlB/FhaC/HecB family [Arcobacter venerupis]RWS48203.1 hemin transporter [Arcobacter venerupis]
MKYLLALVAIFSFSYADISTNIINKNIKDFEEKKVFEEQKKNEKIEENKVYDMKLIEVSEDIKNEENCVKIEKINILNMTVFNEDDFEDLVEPYLNKCNGLKNLSNLKDKISNKYIDKGYVTSRAFFKLQDLSDGVVDIDVVEGKIEKIINENINISNLYTSYENKILNLRDLEVVVQQAERLRSQNLDLQLIPGTKVGYTIVKIVNNGNLKSYFGNIGINNYGTKKTGQYQIYNNFNYENLFGINDILDLNINSTNNIFKNNDKTFGSSINYSFPFERFLFDIFYNYSNYKQINSDEFNNLFQSDGNNDSFGLDISYKLYHSSSHTIELLLNFQKKETENVLNDVRLDLQSYSSSSFEWGIKHSYKGDSFDYYSKFLMSQGLSGESDEYAKQEIDFTKYVLDLGFNKYFDTSNNLKYNFYLRGQISDNNLFGTEEISMGGVYSVRGFNDTGLSGNIGFYTRNELSAQYNLDDYIVIPYLGLDYGYVTENENNIGGNIIGSAIGTRFYLGSMNLELFYNLPLKDAENTKDESSNFFGFNLMYNY